MNRSIENSFAQWAAPQCPFTIEYSTRVLDDIRVAVVEAFHSLARGGVEVGGLLLGSFRNGCLTIDGKVAVECEHAFGPSFKLSPPDIVKLQKLLGEYVIGDGRPVGWYHSHTRSGIFLSDADLEIHHRFFPEPWQVALVLRPQTLDPVRAGFFVRESDGSIQAAASYGEFQLDAQPFRQAGGREERRAPASASPTARREPQFPARLDAEPQEKPAWLREPEPAMPAEVPPAKPEPVTVQAPAEPPPLKSEPVTARTPAEAPPLKPEPAALHARAGWPPLRPQPAVVSAPAEPSPPTPEPAGVRLPAELPPVKPVASWVLEEPSPPEPAVARAPVELPPLKPEPAGVRLPELPPLKPVASWALSEPSAPAATLAEVPPPNFLTNQPARSRGWMGFVTLLLGLAVGAAGFQMSDRWLPRIRELFGRAAVSPPVTPGLSSLGLAAIDSGGQLQIRWNREAPDIRNSTGGLLTISEDGVPPRLINLDLSLLHSGTFTYARQSGQVDVRLTVHPPGGAEVVEVATFLGQPPVPVPAIESPAAQKPRDDEAARLQIELEKQATRTKKLEKTIEDMRLEAQRQRQLRRMGSQSPESVKK